jgi:putative glycosyltransferase (TIGR04372 family)
MLETDSDLTSAVNLQRSGLELVHNTPDEISAVVREMEQRIDGTWLEAEEDEELQRRFGALYQPAHVCYGMPGCIGAEFLRQHSYLL